MNAGWVLLEHVQPFWVAERPAIELELSAMLAIQGQAPPDRWPTLRCFDAP
jgi:hypothetical protein